MHASISVIIPTWNRSDTLIRAINSVLEQTVSVLEILVCDDGSTDNSMEIVQGLDNQTVKWIAGEHTGYPSTTRNRGIKIAKGEWIAFLDSDDEWLPSKLHEQLNVFKKSGNRAICTNAWRILPNAPETSEANTYIHQSEDSVFQIEDIIKSNTIITSSVLIKKDLIERSGYFSESKNLKVYEDFGLWLKILHFEEFYYLSKPLTKYYDDPPQSIRGLVKANHVNQMVSVLGNIGQWQKKNIPYPKDKKVQISRALKQYKSLRLQNYKKRISKLLMKIIDFR